jgi:hypothetical protein
VFKLRLLMFKSDTLFVIFEGTSQVLTASLDLGG